MEPGSTFKETRGTLEVEVFSHSPLASPGEMIGYAVGPCKGCEETTESEYAEGDEDDWWCAECWGTEEKGRLRLDIHRLEIDVACFKLRAEKAEVEVEKLKDYLNGASRREGKTIEELDWYKWYRGGDSGLSSETIFQVMTGIPVKWTSTPMDSADFGRCSRLLDRFPKWRDRLHEVSEQFPEWKQLIDNWSKLESLYEKEKHSEVYEMIKVCCHHV